MHIADTHTYVCMRCWAAVLVSNCRACCCRSRCTTLVACNYSLPLTLRFRCFIYLFSPLHVFSIFSSILFQFLFCCFPFNSACIVVARARLPAVVVTLSCIMIALSFCCPQLLLLVLLAAATCVSAINQSHVVFVITNTVTLCTRTLANCCRCCWLPGCLLAFDWLASWLVFFERSDRLHWCAWQMPSLRFARVSVSSERRRRHRSAARRRWQNLHRAPTKTAAQLIENNEASKTCLLVGG